MPAPSAVIDLLLPRTCVGCARAGEPWCAACWPAPGRLRLRLAGRAVVARTAYAGATRAALLAYKERGRRDLAAPLAGLLREAVTALGPGAPAVLVPVPSRPAAVRARGGDHLLRLARRAARDLDVPVERALRVSGAVRDSAGLDAAGRAANLRGAVRAAAGHGRTAVVVDDIATTGASLRAAFAALTQAGWEIAGAAVVAATP